MNIGCFKLSVYTQIINNFWVVPEYIYTCKHNIDNYVCVYEISSDRDSGRRPSVHQKGEREQGAIMRRNSLNQSHMSRWRLSPISLAGEIHIKQDLGYTIL